MNRKNFCCMNPFFYMISSEKGIFLRHIRNLTGDDKFAKTIQKEKLPVIVKSHSSHLIKKGKGIDPVLQQNKAVNIDIAGSTMNGMVVHPGRNIFILADSGKDHSKKRIYGWTCDLTK